MTRVLVIGDLEIARITCATLTARGTEVVHLPEPTDAELHDALSAPADAVAVLVRGDVSVLRYALLVEHLQPLVRLVATVFDRTLAAELTRAVQNSQITSPADVCVPSMVARCLGNDVLAVIEQAGQPTEVIDVGGELQTRARAWAQRRTRDLSKRVAAQLRPYDSATRILSAGGAGLLLMIALDWIISAAALHETIPATLYSATRIVATVGPAAAQDAPNWYLVSSSLCMLTTIGL